MAHFEKNRATKTCSILKWLALNTTILFSTGCLAAASNTAPLAPSALTATATSTSQVSLSFTDNSSNEQGFVIMRSLNSSTGFSQIATLAANVVRFSDAGLSASTPYYYRVAAFRKVKGASVFSAYSNLAAVTTLAQTTPPPPPPSTPAPTPIPDLSWVRCASENAICSFTGTRQVRYGANGIYNYKTATDSISCDNATFGDPLPGVVKACDYSTTATSATPAPTPVPPAPTATPTPSPVTTGSIDAVIAAMPSNSWKSLPSTQMKDVCPTPYNHYLCEAVVSAWGGGAYDQARDRMVIFGGGHTDSWYNNIFAFDLPSMKWLRLSEMGEGATGEVPGAGWTDIRVETCGFYPKGPLTIPSDVMLGNYVDPAKCFVEPVVSQLDFQQPRSPHSYGGLFVDRVNDRYCSLAGNAYPSGQTNTPVINCFDPKTGRWSRIADRPKDMAFGQSALDANGNMWTVAGGSGYMSKYDPIANSWQTFGYNNYDTGGGTDIDRKRNHLYTLNPREGGSYILEKSDLNAPSTLMSTPTYTIATTSGDLPTNIGVRPGFIYADALGKFFAWGGGRDLYTFDPVTSIWKKLPATGDDPGAQQTWGTYGRFRFSSNRGVFVLMNSTEQNVFIYKP